MMQDSFKYQGQELELFQHAKNWKNYFSNVLKPFIKGDVLEAGAGLGATTLLLNDGSASSWVLLEPDPAMIALLEKKVSEKQFPGNVSIKQGTIENLPDKFDTIIYIDVLEHIESDAVELSRAASHLKPAGHILVLSPAFQSLYNPFDKAIGHYRRYNKRTIHSLTPHGLELEKCAYYDSIGFFAAGINKILLRKKYPTHKQVLLWDRWMVPVSKITDRLFFHSFGKSIIAVWKKTGSL